MDSLIDQPEVLAFKTQTLAEHDASPSVARYIAVPTDLRGEWPKALRDAGFDPTVATAWAAEGLLGYLHAAAQDQLFTWVHELSAKGSRIAVDALSAEFFDPANLARLKAQFDGIREAVTRAGGMLPDVPNLWFDEERADVADWLRQHRWNVNAIDVNSLMAGYDRQPPADVGAAIPRCVFVSGNLM